MNFIKQIKHFFDKYIFYKYNKNTKLGLAYNETLIRKMFPWIYRVDDKKILHKLLKETESDFRKVLNTYYRSEVNQLIEQKKYDEIVKYEWILKLVSDLTYLYNNPNEYEWWYVN